MSVKCTVSATYEVAIISQLDESFMWYTPPLCFFFIFLLAAVYLPVLNVKETRSQFSLHAITFSPYCTFFSTRTIIQ